MIYIGIDIDKKKCVACLQDETGHILNEIKFENKKSGFQTLLNIVKGREARAVIKSTGNFSVYFMHNNKTLLLTNAGKSS